MNYKIRLAIALLIGLACGLFARAQERVENGNDVKQWYYGYIYVVQSPGVCIYSHASGLVVVPLTQIAQGKGC